MTNPDWSFGGLPAGVTPPARPQLTDSAKFAPGLVVDHYRLLELLGTGAMGAVYRAQDQRFGREVAIKFVLGRLEERSLRRFQREGEALAAIRHPGILAVHDQGTFRGRPYLVIELVKDARPLDEALPHLTRDQALRVVLLAGQALGSAHKKGIVHRDVKPGNILVDPEGLALVSDFGLATGERFKERLTQTGALVGTPINMAPEQLRAEREAVGPPSDVWALGTVLYQVLTGSLAFEAETLPELMVRISKGQHKDPRRTDPSISRALVRVIATCLQPDPARRYPDGAAFAEALQQAIDAAPEVRSRWKLPLAIAATLVAVGGAGWRASVKAASTPESSPPASSPDPTTRWVELAEQLEREGDDLGALAALTAAVKEDPRRARLWAERASLLRGLGRLDEALRDLDRAMEVDPTEAYAWHILAAIRWELEDFSAARSAAERSLELDPGAVASYALMTELLRLEDDLAGAERVGRRGLEIEPDDPQAINNLALVLLEQGQLDQAEALLRRVTELDPSAQAPWGNLAAVFITRRDLPAALDVYDQGLRVAPEAPLFLVRAELRHHLDDSEGALADLSRCLELEPEQIEALLLRSRIFIEAQEREPARVDLHAILRARPEKASVWGTVAERFQGLNDLEAARQALRGAVEREGRPDWWNQLGLIAEGLGDHDEAEEAYGKAIELASGNAAVWFNRGDLRQRVGDLEGARHDLRRAFELGDEDHAERIAAALAKVELALGSSD